MEYLTKIVMNINDLLPAHLFAKEGDKLSRGLQIQLLSDNEIIDTTGLTVELFAKHEDMEEPEKMIGEPVNEKEGIYRIYYSPEIMKAEKVKCELRFRVGEEAVATSLPFEIRVGGKLWN